MQNVYNLSGIDFGVLAQDYDFFSGYSEGRWRGESSALLLPFSAEVVDAWVSMVSGSTVQASVVSEIVQYFGVKSDEWTLQTYPDWGDERDLEHYALMGRALIDSKRNAREEFPVVGSLSALLPFVVYLFHDDLPHKSSPQYDDEESQQELSMLSPSNAEFRQKMLGMLWTSRDEAGLQALPWYSMAEVIYEMYSRPTVGRQVYDYDLPQDKSRISRRDVDISLTLAEVLDMPDTFFIMLPYYNEVKKALSASDLEWVKDKLFYYLHAWAKKVDKPWYQLGRLLTIGLGPVLGFSAAEVNNEIARQEHYKSSQDLSVLVSQEIEMAAAGSKYKAKLPDEEVPNMVQRLREKVGDLKTLLLADLLLDYIDKIERQQAYALEPNDVEVDDVAGMLMDVEMSEDEQEEEMESDTDQEPEDYEEGDYEEEDYDVGDEQLHRARAFVGTVIDSAE